MLHRNVRLAAGNFIQRGHRSWRPTRAAILKRIKDEEIEWVDLRFTDPKGKWQHLTMAPA